MSNTARAFYGRFHARLSNDASEARDVATMRARTIQAMRSGVSVAWQVRFDIAQQQRREFLQELPR